MNEKVAELTRQIEELKRRFPAHSIPPALMADLDRLEEALQQAVKEAQDGQEAD